MKELGSTPPDRALQSAGGGLFVGGIVAGVIMLGNGGAKARGALLRDVSAYCISVVVLTACLGRCRGPPLPSARCAMLSWVRPGITGFWRVPARCYRQGAGCMLVGHNFKKNYQGF